MHQLATGVGTTVVCIAAAALLAFETLSMPESIGIQGREGTSCFPWMLGVTSWTRLTIRDWAVSLATLAFVGLNFFLWSLPITQAQLFLISLPLGVVAFAAFIWLAPQK